MRRAEVLTALHGHLKVLRDTPQGDAIVDLLEAAYGTVVIVPVMGKGEPFAVIRPMVEEVLAGWEYMGRRNEPVCASYREGARALRFLIAQAKAEALA